MAIEEGSSYGVKCRFLHSFAITPWECEAMEQPANRDWISTVVRMPARMLRFDADIRHAGIEVQDPLTHIALIRTSILRGTNR